MINPCLSQAERIRLGLTPDPSIVPPAPEPEAAGVVCADDWGRVCTDRKCRRCNGTKRVRFIFFLGRYRTRVDIARWFLARPEWRGCKVKTKGTSLYLGKGRAIMRLDHFTPEELSQFASEIT